jgi:alpha-ketoglutarate-dependent taurine dioxygenase
MALDIEPVDASFAAVVKNVRVTDLDEAAWTELYDAWLKYALLIFPGQHLTREEQVAFARRFGPLEFDLSPISNVRPDGTVRTPDQDEDFLALLASTENWHADSTYKPIQAKGAVFCADILPEGGTQTGFADMRAAYDALDPAMRTRVEGLRAYHSFDQQQARRGHRLSSGTTDELRKAGGGDEVVAFNSTAAPLRPLVKVHPETGRKSLLLGYHLIGIQGMADEAAKALLDELLDFACQAPRTYHHAWGPGDAVIWDNRCLLHRARPWDMSLPRVMWHSRIAGDPVTEAALA